MNGFFHRSIAVLALAAALAGCASSPAQVAQRNSERCIARGLSPNTDAFNECVTRMDNDRDIRITSRHRDLMERSSSSPLR